MKILKNSGRGILKRVLTVIPAIAVCCTNLFGGTDLTGTTSSNFEKIQPFARAAGMGEAFTAVSEGTYGLYYNPAGIASIPGFEAQFTHVSWFQDINYDYLSLVGPSPGLNNSRIGFALALFRPGELTRTGELTVGNNDSYLDNYAASGLLDEKFYPYDLSAILGYGIDINTELSAGIRLKYTSQNISTYSGSNITVDSGLLYKIISGPGKVRLGIDISNLVGSKLALGSAAFDPPLILNAGISDEMKIWTGTLLVSAQAEIPDDYDTEYSLGCEYWFYDAFALRIGYEAGAYNRPTFGAGARYRGFEADYAYINYSELGATHRISLLYGWGAAPLNISIEPSVFSPNNDKILDYARIRMATGSNDKLRSLTLNILDGSGKSVLAKIPVKDITSNAIRWDGAVNGKTLADGAYKVSVKAVYDNGTSESNIADVEIDDTYPDMKIELEEKSQNTPADNTVILPAVFDLYAKDRNHVASWEVVIWGTDRKIFFRNSGKGEPPAAYVWDGKSSSDAEAEPKDGSYYYSLITVDSVGNRGMTKPQAMTALTKDIKLAFSADALFDIGRTAVKISAYSMLKTMKDTIDRYPESKIKISGYTDDIKPQGIKYSDNTELSKKRAEAVKFFMINLLGYDESRISTEGYGELNPIADNSTEEGRIKNRRVEITLYR
jgi:flagellar motor protein MotB